MVHNLAKRLHEILCKPNVYWHSWEEHIPEAERILGDEYAFITTEEFANLRKATVTV